MKMRQCLIGDADIAGGNPSVEIDSQCTHDAATRAYNLARRYRNSTVDVEQARRAHDRGDWRRERPPHGDD